MTSLPLRRDFVRFDTVLDSVAATWEPLEAEEVAKRVMTPYQLMAEKVIDRVSDTDQDLHTKLVNDNARHGALVLGRFCNIAALVANREGFDKPGLAGILANPVSFGTIADIATTQDEVAVKTESTIGVRGYYTEDELALYKLRHWALDNTGGLVVPKMPEIQYESLVAVAMKGRLDMSQPHECSAHSNKMLDRIYQKFTQICMDDPLLFDATLQRTIRFSANPTPTPAFS